jgi:hypothetical protein
MSQIDTGNRFLKFTFDGKEEEVARCITPYNMMFIQNKIADYAAACVEFKYDPANPNQIASIIEHENLKAKVEILQELLTEMNVPLETQSSSQSE